MRRSDQPKTGSSSLTVADLAIQTSARDLLFQRSYSSGGTETVTQELGYGWIHNQAARLILPDDPGGMEGFVLFQSVIGRQYLFKIEADGSYTPGPAVLAILTKSTDTYTITDSQKETFSFDAGGRLIAREDAQGHPLEFSYDAEGRLSRISADGDTRYIQIEYDLRRDQGSECDECGR